MKITILRSVEPNARYVDADTGQVDTPNRQAREPIRLLPKGQPEPQKATREGIEQALAERRAQESYQSAVKAMRTIVGFPIDRAIKDLMFIGKVDEQTARSFRDGGPSCVDTRYADWERARLSAEMARSWQIRFAKWQSNENSRKESLGLWQFRNKIVQVIDWQASSREEITTLIKHKVLREEKAFAKIRHEIELFEKLDGPTTLLREPIPDDVKMFVWRRDSGRCVRCGSQERIEFDHIIPLEKGGSNTARNLQILCERCNREKGTSI